jgi:hypothetical protein
LKLVVQDLEATKTRLSRIKGLQWISASALGSVVVRDPDGIFVELQRIRTGLSPIGAAADDPKVRLGITVEDPDRTMGFYREALGFTRGANSFAAGSRCTWRFTIRGRACCGFASAISTRW